jgi:Big-like domain-containing protein
MPSVVRSTFVLGVFAFAAATATACGDKVNVTQPAKDTSVQSVTVSPPGPVPLKVGDKVTFSASVQGGADLTNRAVTWKSSAPTIASVDNTGLVTALAGGTASIIATSVANTAISGAAVVTVAASVPATVTIGQINQTVCTAANSCTSVPATLSNVANQLDVTLNVDPGTQTISEVDLVMNCTGAGNSGQDTVVARQTLGSGDVAPLAVEAASSPVTLSFNTAAFNATTGVVAFRNGQCTLKAKALTSGGTQVASGSQQLTLNNINVVIATMTTTPGTGQKASATDAAGLLWRAGAVNVTAVPVLYTAGSIAAGAINLINAGGSSAIGQSGASVNTVAAGGTVATNASPTLTAGVFTATFGTSTTAAGNVGGAVVPVLSVSVSTVDNSGNPGPTLAASSTNFIRLDNRAPNITGVTFTAGKQNTANGWVGKAFVFSIGTGTNDPIAPGNTATDNAADLASAPGVDNVTYATQFAPNGSTTWTTFTSVTGLTETGVATGAGSYNLRLQVCDALGNCANTPNLTATGFGVDLTAPTAVTSGGPKNNEIDGIGVPISSSSVTVAPTDPQGANGVTGSGFGTNFVLATETLLAPSGASGQATTCVIGNPLSPNTGCSSGALVPMAGQTFTVATADPGQYALSYVVVDQAGNQSAPVALNYYLDGASATAPAAAFAPAMSGGIGIPASITNGAVFSASGVDNMDFASANAVLIYPAATVVIPAVSSAAGVAFDNVLTRTSNVTVTLANFMRSLGVVNAGVITSPQAKPGTIGIRGLDAANNLSAQDAAALPGTNISNPTTLAIGTDLADFSIAIAPPAPTTVSNGTGTLARSTTLTATLQAVDANHGTPFAQVCFYIINGSGQENGQANVVTGSAAGELVQLGCTGTTTTTIVGTTKLIQSTFSFDPDAKYGISGSLNFVAIGITANGDALVTGTATSLTLAQ